MRVVIHEIVLRTLHGDLTTQECRPRSNELTDLGIDDAHDGMGVDMQDHESLFMEMTVIHLSEELDDQSWLEPSPNLRQPKVVREARTQVHARLLIVQLGDDFFGIRQGSRDGLDRHRALAYFIFCGEVPGGTPRGIVA